MKKLSLFKGKRIIAAFIVIACILIVIFYSIRVTEFTSSGFILMAVMATNIYVFTFDFFTLKKFFLKFEKDTIQWRFPCMQNNSKITLYGGIHDITQDWKGIHFMNNKKTLFYYDRWFVRTTKAHNCRKLKRLRLSTFVI